MTKKIGNILLVLAVLLIKGCSGSDDRDEQEPDEPETMETTVLKTPPERFENLVGYPFPERFVTVTPFNLQMHYVEAGPENGTTVLLLHGNPNWSYGLRELITLFADNGYHVFAPDLIGFGKSDKPIDRSMHDYDNQEAWITSFIEELNLTDIHLHCQDWGGLIGLRVAVQQEGRFKSVAISNTDLPVGNNVSQTFLNWQVFSQTVPNYSFTVQSATFNEISEEELRAFDAPFPAEEYKAGPRQLPLEVPTDPQDSDAVVNKALRELWTTWEKPFLTLFSIEDNISPEAEVWFQQNVPGAQEQPHQLLPDTGHFIREDAPEDMFALLDQFIRSAD